jgi:hypothetical protein
MNKITRILLNRNTHTNFLGLLTPELYYVVELNEERQIRIPYDEILNEDYIYSLSLEYNFNSSYLIDNLRKHIAKDMTEVIEYIEFISNYNKLRIKVNEIEEEAELERNKNG